MSGRLKHSGLEVECYGCGKATEVPIEQLRQDGWSHPEDVNPADVGEVCPKGCGYSTNKRDRFCAACGREVNR